jgi:hypothetical protein
VAPNVALLGTAHVRGLDVAALQARGCLCPMTRDVIEDEETWLRRYVVRLRTILRFAVDARVQTELRGFIAEAEDRLEQLYKTRTHRP